MLELVLWNRLREHIRRVVSCSHFLYLNHALAVSENDTLRRCASFSHDEPNTSSSISHLSYHNELSLDLDVGLDR